MEPSREEEKDGGELAEPSLFVSAGSGETTAMDRAVLHNPTVIALLALLLRCCVGLHPHSGQGSPPLYGSLEAQRKRMELTVHSPMCSWYAQGYSEPPLHAFLSLLFGSLASSLVPNMVAGEVGYESEDARALLRASVLAIDAVILFSAVWFFCHLFYRSNVKLDGCDTELKDTAARFLLYSRRSPTGRVKSRRRRSSGSSFSASTQPVSLVSEVFLIVLLQPSIVLVDHGLFGYNVLTLGLMTWCLVFCLEEYFVFATVSFALLVNYDTNGLWYAPPMAIFLFLNASRPWLSGVFLNSCWRIARYSAAACLTGVVLWAPVICTGDWRLIFTSSIRKPRLWPCMLGALPSLFDLARRLERPVRTRRLVWALFNTSLSCVLFSVSEVQVLLPLLLAALLVGEVPGPSTWFSIVAMFSLGPLLYAEKLAVPAVVTTSVFTATSAICFRGELRFLPLPWMDQDPASPGVRHGIRMIDSFVALKIVFSITVLVAILAFAFPESHSLWLFVHLVVVKLLFFIAWLYGNWYQWMLPSEELIDPDRALVKPTKKNN